jgi:hypothetical protein
MTDMDITIANAYRNLCGLVQTETSGLVAWNCVVGRAVGNILLCDATL